MSVFIVTSQNLKCILSLQEFLVQVGLGVELELTGMDHVYLAELWQNGISEERKWILVSSLLLSHICNYHLVFTEELSPYSQYWGKTFEEVTYTEFIKRTVCFNNVSECLVAWHIRFRIAHPVKERRYIRMESVATTLGPDF